MNVAVYISAHGFGHLAQMVPVLQQMRNLRPESSYLIRSSLPVSEIRNRLGFDVEIDSTPVDVGVVQKSAIEEDRAASIARMRDWCAGMNGMLERETELLRAFNPALVLSNISPLAFPVARALGVPGIGLASLDWHTIYSHWLAADDAVLETLAEAYGVCDLLLTPPMAMDMYVFPKRRHIPLIAANPQPVANLYANDARKKALVLFGGCAHPPFDPDALATMHDWLFITPDAAAVAPENVRAVTFDAALRPVDLMPFVDVVVCKPGYGVLAECWRTGTPIAWVERPDFPEFPVLKQWLEESFPSCGMNRQNFANGNWLPTLEKAVRCDRNFPALKEGGAVAAARMIERLAV